MMDRVGAKQGRARFQALCLALRPDLLRFAFWLCHDHALAEDVVQESMLRAWKAQESLEDEKLPSPGFLTIVRRELARTFERKRLNTVNIDDLVALEDSSLAAAIKRTLRKCALPYSSFLKNTASHCHAVAPWLLNRRDCERT